MCFIVKFLKFFIPIQDESSIFGNTPICLAKCTWGSPRPQLPVVPLHHDHQLQRWNPWWHLWHLWHQNPWHLKWWHEVCLWWAIYLAYCQVPHLQCPKHHLHCKDGVGKDLIYQWYRLHLHLRCWQHHRYQTVRCNKREGEGSKERWEIVVDG